jgi:hypothetical protein
MVHCIVKLAIHGGIGFPAHVRYHLDEPVFYPKIEALDDPGHIEFFDSLEHIRFEMSASYRNSRT